MRNLKRFSAFLVVLMMALSGTALAAVEDTGFSDVDAGAWYAEAVMYCREHMTPSSWATAMACSALTTR